MSMIAEEEHNEDVLSFAYTSLCVALNFLFDQISGFELPSRDGCDLPPITSLTYIPSDIRGLKKDFNLRNSPSIEQHGKYVKRKSEGVEVEPPKSKRNAFGCRLDGNAGYTFSGTPSLTVTLLISAGKHLKAAIERAK